MAINDVSHADLEPMPETAKPGFVAIKIPLRLIGFILLIGVALSFATLSSWSVDDPSLSYATDASPKNWLGFPGAIIADIWMQFFGLASLIALLPPAIWGWGLSVRHVPDRWFLRLGTWILGMVVSAGVFAFFVVPATWPLPTGLGGLVGETFPSLYNSITGSAPTGSTSVFLALVLLAPAILLIWTSMGLSSMQRQTDQSFEPSLTASQSVSEEADRTGFFDILFGALVHFALSAGTAWRRALTAASKKRHEIADANWQADMATPAIDGPLAFISSSSG